MELYKINSSKLSSGLKKVNPECSLEGLMLKLQYFGPVMQSRLSGKHQDARKDRRLEEKGMIKEEMVQCHHQLSGHECEQTPGGSNRHRSLACCSPRGRKESDTTERLNNKNDTVYNSHVF